MDTDGGDWIELNHPIDADVAKVPFLPVPEFTPIDDASLRATHSCCAPAAKSTSEPSATTNSPT